MEAAEKRKNEEKERRLAQVGRGGSRPVPIMSVHEIRLEAAATG
jgi:hypothetical protein